MNAYNTDCELQQVKNKNLAIEIEIFQSSPLTDLFFIIFDTTRPP